MNLDVDYIGTIDEYLKKIDYRVVYGSAFLWKCFGPNAWSYEIETRTGSSEAVFDKETGEVYQIEVSNPDHLYKWINPNYNDAYIAECKERKIDPDLYLTDSDRKWAQTDSFFDILDKVWAILNNRTFDTRVVVNFYFDNPEDIAIIENAAIRVGKTFDDYFTEILMLYLENNEKGKLETPKFQKKKRKTKGNKVNEQ